MKLHLPHKLRAAVMATLVAFTGFVPTLASGVLAGGGVTLTLASMALPQAEARELTTATTSADGITYNGAIFTVTNPSNGQFHDRTFALTTFNGTEWVLGDTFAGTTNYQADANPSSGAGTFWTAFTATPSLKDATAKYGMTLRLTGVSSEVKWTPSFTDFCLGGLIVDSGTGRYWFYRGGRMEFNGAKDVNVTTYSDLAFSYQGEVAVKKGGNWFIAEGKSITFDNNSSANGNETTWRLCSGASMVLGGAGTLNIGRMSNGVYNMELESSSSLELTGTAKLVATAAVGTISIGENARLSVGAGNTFTTTRELTLLAGGQLVNRGTVSLAESLIGGTITNIGSMTISEALTIEPTGVLNNQSDNLTVASITCNGTLINSGTLAPTQPLYLGAGSVLNNAGNMTLTDLSTKGSVENSGTLTIGGSLSLVEPIQNRGDLVLDGSISIDLTGVTLTKGYTYKICDLIGSGKVLGVDKLSPSNLVLQSPCLYVPTFNANGTIVFDDPLRLTWTDGTTTWNRTTTFNDGAVTGSAKGEVYFAEDAFVQVPDTVNAQGIHVASGKTAVLSGKKVDLTGFSTRIDLEQGATLDLSGLTAMQYGNVSFIRLAGGSELVAGSVSGALSTTVLGNGTLTLAGAGNNACTVTTGNAFAGTVQVNGGTVKLNDSNIGNGSWLLSGYVTGKVGGDVRRNVAVQGDNVVLAADDKSTGTLSGAISGSGVNMDGAGTVDLAGDINLDYIVARGGTSVISSSNIRLGELVVDGGTVKLESSAAGVGYMTVMGGTLAVNALVNAGINNPVTVGNGGVYAVTNPGTEAFAVQKVKQIALAGDAVLMTGNGTANGAYMLVEDLVADGNTTLNVVDNHSSNAQASAVVFRNGISGAVSGMVNITEMGAAAQKFVVVLEDADCMKDAVINLTNQATDGYVVLGVGSRGDKGETTSVQVKGLNTINGNVHLISYTGDYTKAIGDVPSSSGNHEIVITGDSKYDFDGVMGDNLNVTMKGAGAQRFANLGANAVVKAESGMLAFGTASSPIASISIASGAIVQVGDNKVGSLTASRVNINGGELNARLTLQGELYGHGRVDSLVSTDNSSISMDLVGVSPKKAALLTANRADVSGGRIKLKLQGVSKLGYGIYNLLSWEGISLDDFSNSGDYVLGVENNTLQLLCLPPDLYWKGTDGIWTKDESIEWAYTKDAKAESEFFSGVQVHFVGEGSSILVQGSMDATLLEAAEGDWSFVGATGSSLKVGELAVNSGSATIGEGMNVTDAITLNEGALHVNNGAGIAATSTISMQGDSSLSLASDAVMDHGGFSFTGVTISHMGAELEEFSSTAGANFTLSGGTLTTLGSADSTLDLAFSTTEKVAMVHAGTGVLDIAGDATFASLTFTGDGQVKVSGSMALADTGVSGGAVLTRSGAGGFSLGDAASAVSGGSVVTSSGAISATLTDVALTVNNDAALQTSAALSGLTLAGGKTLSQADAVELTHDGIVYSGADISNTGAEDSAFHLDKAGFSVNADTIDAQGKELTVGGDVVVGEIAQVSKVNVKENASVAVQQTEPFEVSALAGSGNFSTNGALVLGSGASTMGALHAESLELKEGASLSAAEVTLDSDRLVLNSLSKATAPLLTAQAYHASAPLTVVLDKETLLGANYDVTTQKLDLASLGGLTAALFEDGTVQQSYRDDKREFTLTTEDGVVSLHYKAIGNGWVSNGTWGSGSGDFSEGNPSATEDADFLGEGSSSVTLVGAKQVNSVYVSVNKAVPSATTAYTLKGDSLKAANLEVEVGELSIANQTTVTDSLSVGGNGSLTVDEGAVLTVDRGANATGLITNEGELVLGAGDLVLAGGGTLGVMKDAQVNLVGDSTVGAINNKGGLNIGGNTLTVTKDTTGGGNVTAARVVLAEDVNAKFDQLLVTDCATTNGGALTVANGSVLHAVSENANLAITKGAVELQTDTTLGSLVNHGSLSLGDKVLTLTGKVSIGGMVKAGSVILTEGKDARFNTLTTTGEVRNAGGTLTVGNGTTLAALTGNGTLNVDGERVSIGRAAAVDALDGTGDLTVADSLKVGSTLAGSAVNLATQVLDVSGSGTTAYTFGDLQIAQLSFDSNNFAVPTPLAAVDSMLAPEEGRIPLLGLNGVLQGDVVIAQDCTQAGVLGAGDYLLLSQTGQISEESVSLAPEMDRAYEAAGMAAILQLSVDRQQLFLTVADDADRVWHTAKDSVEDVFGRDVPITPSGEYVYSALNSVGHIVVDGNRMIDLRQAAPTTEAGLPVRNLTGDDATATLSVVGNGKTEDRITLYATEESEMAGTLLLEATHADVRGPRKQSIGQLDLTNAEVSVKDSANLSVGTFSGDAFSVLEGRLTITKSIEHYVGRYKNATVVFDVPEETEQEMRAVAGANLTTTEGNLATVKLIKGYNEPYALNSMHVNGSKVELGESLDETLALHADSSLVNGELLVNMHADTLMLHSGDVDKMPVLTSGSALDLSGTTVVIRPHIPDEKLSDFAATDSSQALVLATLGDEVISDADTSVMFEGTLFNKFLTRARVSGNLVVADVCTSYYSDLLADHKTANGKVGAAMLDKLLLHYNPQNHIDTMPDLSLTMDVLDSSDPALGDQVAASVAGASVTAMATAFSGDMERQLRSIRNRTQAMGKVQGVVMNGDKNFHAWANAEGDFRTQNADGTAAGYSLNSWGGTVGCDYDFNSTLTAGLAITSMQGDLTSKGPEVCAKGDLNTYYVSAFARAAIGSWVHTLIASVGYADASLDRTLGANGITCSTNGSTSGTSYGAMYEVGYNLVVNADHEFIVRPVFNAAFRHVGLDSYDETGRDASLSVGEQEMDTLTLGLGARVESIIGENLFNRRVKADVRALFKYDAGDRTSTATNALRAYPNIDGTVTGSEYGACGVEIGTGVFVPLGVEYGAMFVDFSAELRSRATNLNATVGYRRHF